MDQADIDLTRRKLARHLRLSGAPVPPPVFRPPSPAFRHHPPDDATSAWFTAPGSRGFLLLLAFLHLVMVLVIAATSALAGNCERPQARGVGIYGVLIRFSAVLREFATSGPLTVFAATLLTVPVGTLITALLVKPW
ncbi:hypothetical protein AB0912_31795 [Streptomyces sp. NPDC007084]|uniref:hypothetical protein n=1 Tax=Streptomyces sp. NPDC007084 TaxID=3154313 RepID=UPI00345529DB